MLRNIISKSKRYAVSSLHLRKASPVQRIAIVKSLQLNNFHYSPSLRKDNEDIVVEEQEEEKQAEKLKQEGLIQETETINNSGQEVKEFQAETRQLLDIVATALYTDKEVFIREIISNASDALEKLRQISITSPDGIEDRDKPFEINISVDEKRRTFTIQDTGIGMSRDELIQNIGTIAHSGSKQFIKQLKEAGKEASSIIGQFGVGFYSIFMVSDKVRVYTRSYVPGSVGYCWESIGGGSYTINEAEGVSRGTKVILYLKDSEKEFSMKDTVERIIKKYSNFIAHKITLNGSRVNTLEAIWLKPKDQVTPEEHKEFYRYISHYGGEPNYICQFATEVPLNIRALFYVPQTHTEKMGMGKMDPGVNVYCRKVLIQAKHKDILPDWLRFVKGVVDSEDLPLNISREHLQDSPLIRRISGILTKRLLKFFNDKLQEDRVKYAEFYEEFNKFFKEGISSDILYKDDLAKLLLFESSKTTGNERITLDEYIARKAPEQKHEIYYLIAPNKAAAESSPYYEVFKKKGLEVLFLFNPVDEFVMSSIATFKNQELKSIERTEIEPDKDEKKFNTGLNKEQVQELSDWFKETMPTRVEMVLATTRLSGTPAIIKNPENAVMRLMRRVQGITTDIGPQKLEINPNHSLVLRLYYSRAERPDLAKLLGEQIYDNALISAGLMEDPRTMLPRLLDLLYSASKDVKVPEDASFTETNKE